MPLTATSPPLSRPPANLLRGASLFLDFDGTIVEIADRPEQVSVGRDVEILIGKLSERLDGRFAIVSGRPSSQIGALFHAPSFPIYGSHGHECRWPDGRVTAGPRPPALDEAAEDMRRFQRRHPGILIEEKPFGVSLHYRLAPSAEDDCRRLATRLAERHGLALQPGKMVFEVRAAGADKGTAVTDLMARPGFSGTRPVFVGDDQTDEAGFAAAARLGGAGVLVGPPRETVALHVLHDVLGVMSWLAAACEALG